MAAAQPSKQERPLHEQVARRFWSKRNCPRCQAPATKNCVADDETGAGVLRKDPHDERVQLIIDEGKARRRQVPGRGKLWPMRPTPPGTGLVPADEGSGSRPGRAG
ncbi:zinc finger domain-containing protein [Streptomyces mirabilis]|jgi:hypothetical protein|uniref:zinc finger domain-containing protein n=1 Tax=Streptomyces mirabilis TaxID=68239 RepID=UPI0015A60C40|nr:hypothetical protein [Streptomyces mirabilis]